jgi:hypothetical protein
MTSFHGLRLETPPTWRSRPPYLYTPRTGWPGYTSRLWSPFLPPPMTRRAMVEVFEPTSTRGLGIHVRVTVTLGLAVYRQSVRLGDKPLQVESYVMPDGSSASLSWNKAPIWGLRPHFYYCQTVGVFVDLGCSLWREDGSVIYNCCWPSSVQSFWGPSPLGLATIFYCLRFETPFSSPPMTRRFTVEVFETVSTRENKPQAPWDSRPVILFSNGPCRRHNL